MNSEPSKLDPPIIGASPAIAEVRDMILRLASASSTVLIRGESGTGKELVAQNLHRLSSRSNRPFVAVNCAAFNPGVLESELFGHGRGAFTGAVIAHAGLFEQANRGTLFLDEIGEVPPSLQAKLLRVLQDREVRRMGASDVTQVDVRVVAATNVDLEERVRDGNFRLDLFYRLAVVEIPVPPLREHTDDLCDLIGFFFARRGRQAPRFSAEASALLREYHWPGNVRELENELERIQVLYPRVVLVEPEMLSQRIHRRLLKEEFDVKQLYDTPLPRAVGYLEENLLRNTLTKTNWNKSESARQLGLSRQGLLKKIRRYGITRVDPSEPPSAEIEA